MNNPADISSREKEYPRFTSLDVEEILIDQPGDMTEGPIPPELVPWALYEQDRMNHPAELPRVPRPGTLPQRPTNTQ